MVVDELIGGSADLTGSNLTKTASLNPVTPDDYSGRYIYYGVREHAMAACMNGIALHGGFIPYGGTFLVFTDYCKPAIRLSALMQQRVIYVMTHDSIGLGEDGPTHQPIEHLAALRAVPNLYVFRPADAVEVAESWQASLQMQNSPSILALTRQGVPLVRENYVEENLCSKGAYILSEAQANDVRVTIYASGSEVEIALNAKRVLESENIGTRVVSAPCLDLFYEQDIEYQTSILCNDSIKVAVEAASKLGWERIIGPHGIFIGMESFGASAPIGDLYKHFQITAENIVNSVKAKIEKKVIYDGTYSN
jgi:transketolase